MTLWEWPNPAVGVLFYIFKIYPEPDHVVSSTWLLPWSEGGRHPPLPTATLSSPTWRWPLRLMPPHYTALLTGRKASVGTEQGPQYVPGPPDPQLPSSRHMPGTCPPQDLHTCSCLHLEGSPLGYWHPLMPQSIILPDILYPSASFLKSLLPRLACHNSI